MNCDIIFIPKGAGLSNSRSDEKVGLLLSLVRTLTRTHEERDFGYWVSIHSKKLRKTLGSRYKETVKEAIRKELIECNESYSAGFEIVDGKKCQTATGPFTKSYRLAPKLRNARVEPFKLTRLANHERVTKLFTPDFNQLKPTGAHYYKCLSMFDFKIEEVSEIECPYTLQSILQWHHGQRFVVRCEYGRFHSPITNISKKARALLTPKRGKDGLRGNLEVVDVSACQPLLMGRLAGAAATRGTDTDPSTEPRQVLSSTVFLNSTDIAARSINRTKASSTVLPYVAQDVSKWVELCESREIYTYLHRGVQKLPGCVAFPVTSSSGRTYTIDLKQKSERDFKRCALIPLFDRLENMVRNPVFRVIEKDFPTIAEWLKASKEVEHRTSSGRILTYQTTACMCQRFESKIMIDDLGEALMAEHPEEPVTPIHDALIVTECFSDKAIQLIKAAFSKYGLNPRTFRQ